MRLKNLRIQSFGKLRGELTFAPGLNVVFASGAAGKTTLAALLFYLFYAADVAALRPLAAYAPLANRTNAAKNFSATATLADGDTIRRDFHSGQPLGENDADSVFLNLSAAEFAAVALTPQESVLPVIPPSLAEKVHRLLDAQNTELAETAALLAALSQELPDDSARRRDALAAAERELAELENVAAEAEAAYRQAEAAPQLARQNELAEQEYLAATARIEELAAQKNEREKITGVLAAAERELAAIPATSVNLADDAAVLDLLKILPEAEAAIAAARKNLRDDRERSGQIAAQLPPGTDGGLSRDELTRLRSAFNGAARENALRFDAQAAFAPLAAAGFDPATAEKLGDFLAASPEREFLRQFPATPTAFAERQSALDDRQKTLATHEQTLAQINAQKTRETRRHVLGAAALGAVGGGLMLTADAPEFFIAPTVWLIYALWRRARARRFDRQMRRELTVEAKQLTDDRRALLAEEEAGQRRLAAAAVALATTPETLRRWLAQASAVESEFAFWRELSARLRQMENDRAAANALWRDKVGLANSDDRHGAGDRHAAGDRQKIKFQLQEAERQLTLREELAALTEKCEAVAAALPAQKAAIAEKYAALRRLLRAAGIGEDTDLTAMARQYQEARQNRRRRDDLAEKIPQYQQILATLPAADFLAADELTRRRAELLAQTPALSAKTPVVSADEYERAADELRRELAVGTAQVAAAEQAWRDAQAAVAERAPTLREQIGAGRAALAQMAKRRAEREAARCDAAAKLARLTEKWREDLTARLNARARPFFPEWRFALDPDLQPTAYLTPFPLDETPPPNSICVLPMARLNEYFSHGMSELFWFLWRQTLAEILAPPLLIMDEPLASCDDEIFMRAFRGGATGEVADKTAQIFVFTSRRQRAEALGGNRLTLE
ncbi:hypothetical protein FACS1894139_12440 [Planctomycetales bacterium]|nr:hypothetical protein FACS1894107_05460 [Planctomycetales bacterium]GHS96728.1 hypothetical protein FACS1894108_01860 [Planctomycetales bacterium]GHT06486.1 hypothetical protein FACS1894139_12440 [Planctomycetales bacterium]